jgi:TATA-box binding protein (TBP) (component of TFIID and TFIIIB)
MEQVLQKAIDIDNSFLDTLKKHSSVQTINSTKICIKTPYITTITVCFATNIEFDIDTFVEVHTYLSKDTSNVSNPYNLDIGYVKNFVDTVFNGYSNCKISIPRIKRNHKNSNKFLNCVVFKTSSIAVKCFTNGIIHITGTKTFQHAIEVAESFCVYYDLILGGDGFQHNIILENFDVQLINVHFSIDLKNGCLNLEKLFKLLISKTEHLSMYNNDRHAGVIIKLLLDNMRTISIIVFDSGNILICALCESKEFTIAFRFINDFIINHWDVVWNSIKIEKQYENMSLDKGKKRKRFDYGSYLLMK